MKNKKFWLLTSAVTLLPAVVGLLLWDRLPEKLPTHFGISGAADGWSGKAFAVFGIPVMMLLFHWLIHAATLLDRQNRGHNEKVLNLVGLLFPGMSLFFALLIYSHGLGLELNLTSLLLPLLGLFFILIGNWLPKVKQNTTLGIKLKWTLYNEENWNRTHRFGGFCWCLGGILFCLMGFLPGNVLAVLLPLQLVLLAVIPTVYSWALAKKQQREGTYTESQVSKNLKKHPIVKVVSLVLVAALLIFMGIVLFTGDISYTCTGDALLIDADFHTDSTVPYDRIDSVELRETAPEGTRQWGFGSPRLLMGFFENDEFGGHTRYSYTRTDAHIVLTCGGDILLLSAEDEAATRALYEELLAHIRE